MQLDGFTDPPAWRIMYRVLEWQEWYTADTRDIEGATRVERWWSLPCSEQNVRAGDLVIAWIGEKAASRHGAQ